MLPTGRLSRYISFSKPRMLSALGRCFTFDASADGYARGEGAGAVLLRLPEEAIEAARTAEQPEATLGTLWIARGGRQPGHGGRKNLVFFGEFMVLLEG